MIERALECRQRGEFLEGVFILNEAAEKGNDLAMLHIAFAYKYGGWGVLQDRHRYQTYMEKAVQMGNKFARMYLNRRMLIDYRISDLDQLYNNVIFSDDLYIDRFIDEAVRLGDEFAQIVIVEKLSAQKTNLRKADLLKFNMHSAFIVSGLVQRLFVFTNYTELHALYSRVERQGCLMGMPDLMTIYEYSNSSSLEYLCKILLDLNACEAIINNSFARNPTCKYLIGKHFYFVWSNVQPTIQYYQKIRARFQRAVIQWLLCGKRLPLVKDVTRLIGKMVWSMRETEPSVYDKGENKFKKIKKICN